MTKQCEGTTAKGTQCKRMTHKGDYCIVHQSVIDEAQAIDNEWPEALTLVVDEDNYNFIMWLTGRPEFDFKDENGVISWMLRSMLKGNMIYQTKETFNFLHDVWIHENR